MSYKCDHVNKQIWHINDAKFKHDAPMFGMYLINLTKCKVVWKREHDNDVNEWKENNRYDKAQEECKEISKLEPEDEFFLNHTYMIYWPDRGCPGRSHNRSSLLQNRCVIEEWY
jgi:hypothetical protein